MADDNSFSEMTRQNSLTNDDLFSRRPDLESVVLDALELSMSDFLGAQTPSKDQQSVKMERQAIKSQITETIKKSQRDLQSMIYGHSSKR